jgi:hypothetical protein
MRPEVGPLGEGEGLVDSDGDGLVESEGEGSVDGESEGEGESDGVSDGDGDGESEGESDGDGESVGDGLGESDGDALGVGVGEASGLANAVTAVAGPAMMDVAMQKASTKALAVRPLVNRRRVRVVLSAPGRPSRGPFPDLRIDFPLTQIRGISPCSPEIPGRTTLGSPATCGYRDFH